MNIQIKNLQKRVLDGLNGKAPINGEPQRPLYSAEVIENMDIIQEKATSISSETLEQSTLDENEPQLGE